MVDEGGVPVFVRKCVEFVEREGLRSEGIYRVPGKKENVLLLQDKFEESELQHITYVHCRCTIPYGTCILLIYVLMTLFKYYANP